MSDDNAHVLTLVGKINELADTVNGMDDRMGRWEKTQTEIHEARLVVLNSLVDNVNLVQQTMFNIADAKTIAMQVRKDFDAHEENHRWSNSVQLGKVVGAAGATVGAVGWLGRNWDRLHAVVHRLLEYGKPPHS